MQNYLQAKFQKLHNPNTSIIVAILAYLILWIAIFRYYIYQTDPDGISYIGIAQKYALGNFKDAINPHWGPFLSWLLIPFLILNIDPLFASKILYAIVGVFTIFGFWKLASIFEIPEKFVKILLVPLILLALYFSPSPFTPDFLLTCLLIYYFYFIFSKKYPNNLTYALFCGLLGGLATLTKPYAFYLFIAHFLYINIYYLIKKEKSALRNLIAGFLVFTAITGAWIVISSLSQGKFTFWVKNYGNFANRFIGSGRTGESIYEVGFIEPPNATATSFWENPLVGVSKLPAWNPFSSIDTLIYQLKLIKGNLIWTFRIFNSFSYFSFLIITGFIIFSIKRLAKEKFPIELKFLSVFALFTPYVFVNVVERYYWTLDILLLLMTAYLSSKLKIKYFFSVILILSFAILPITSLIKYYNFGEDLFLLSKKIEGEGVKGVKLASDSEWGGMMTIAFFTDSQYYGQAKKDLTPEQLLSELKKYKIDYYFLWGKQDPSLFDSKFKQVSASEFPELKIYKLQ